MKKNDKQALLASLSADAWGYLEEHHNQRFRMVRDHERGQLDFVADDFMDAADSLGCDHEDYETLYELARLV